MARAQAFIKDPDGYWIEIFNAKKVRTKCTHDFEYPLLPTFRRERLPPTMLAK